jgi:alkylhydroperoxidase family enzyme
MVNQRNQEDEMSETRIPKTEITGVLGAVAKRFSTKMLGEVPEQLDVMWHNKSVLMTMMGLSKKAKKWNECDENLKAFAHMATMALIGCRFCLDLGYFMAHHDGLDVERAREVPRWRESDVFTPLERDVMDYAEAMSQTPPTVTDELSARLLKSLGAPALLELTAYVTLANMAARMNIAIGPFESQGFATACGLRPLAEPSTSAGAVASRS